MVKTEFEQPAERTSKFSRTFFEDPGWNQVWSGGFVWLEVLQEFPNILRLENYFVKGFGCC
jgi:hypothetical protein